MTIPFCELSKSAQDSARDPLERGFTVMARRAGRGHQLKLAFGAIERNEMERAGFQVVKPPAADAPGEATTYHLFCSPRSGIAHLSRDSRYTLCGWSVRERWVDASAMTASVCQICLRIGRAELAAEALAPQESPPWARR